VTPSSTTFPDIDTPVDTAFCHVGCAAPQRLVERINYAVPRSSTWNTAAEAINSAAANACHSIQGPTTNTYNARAYLKPV
jgi:hypothetical protein